jgi:hypothetical protein
MEFRTSAFRAERTLVSELLAIFEPVFPNRGNARRVEQALAAWFSQRSPCITQEFYSAGVSTQLPIICQLDSAFLNRALVAAVARGIIPGCP